MTTQNPNNPPPHTHWGRDGGTRKPVPVEDDISDLIPEQQTSAEAFAKFHGKFAFRGKLK